MKEAARRRPHLREAALALSAARVNVLVLPAGDARRWLNRYPRRRFLSRDDEVLWIRWAVEHAARRMRIGLSSLPSALAMQAMLRRRGIHSQLCLGIELAPTITSHAWVELSDGRMVGWAEGRRLIKFEL